MANIEGSRTKARRFWRSSAWAVAIGAAVTLLGSASWAQNQQSGDPNLPALRLIKLIPINGTAANHATQMFSFDISWWDPTTGLFFLGDRSNAALDVIDTTGAHTGTPDSLFGQIGGNPSFNPGFAGDTGNTATSGPNGVTVAPNIPCIFATDTAPGGGGRVVSINYQRNFTALAGDVHTGGKFRADELAFDPNDNLLLVVNNADTPPFFTMIHVDPSSCALTLGQQTILSPANHVNATNGAEQPVWQPSTQRFFLSIPEVDGDGSGAFPKGAVAQVNTSGTVEGLYQINFCQPAGLTNNPNNGDLLVGCNSVFDLSASPTSTNHKCTAVVPTACTASATPGTCTAFSGNSPRGTAQGAPATCLNGIAGAQVAICNPARGCTGNALVSVPGVGGGDEVWFNSGDSNYYVTGGNNPGGPVFGVVGSSGTSANVLTQLVPTLQPVPAVTTGTAQHGAGTVHSIAASAANNHVYVALPANNSYQIDGVGCAQGCIAVFSAQ